MTQTATHTPPDPNDLLMGGGVPSAAFKKHGAFVAGSICEPPKTQQQRDFTTQELKFWDDGSPMWQVVVTLQTGEIGDDIEDDDGRRRIYLKNNMKKAVNDAVRKAGAKGLEVGGHLTVTYMGDGKADRGLPPKLYSAVYVPASDAAMQDGRSEDEPKKPAGYATYAEAAAECASVKIPEADLKAALKKHGFTKWDNNASTFVGGWITNTLATRGLKKRNEPLTDDDIPF